MKRTAIKAICILLATIAFLGGCSRKEQPKAETTTPAVAKETATPTAGNEATKPTTGGEASKRAEQSANTPVDGTVAAAGRPRLEYYPKPAYPAEMQARCIEGESRVTMRVDTEGKPENITIAESTDPAFSEALMKVLPTWRFAPAEKNGVAVARTVSIAIPFIINNRPLDLPKEVTNGQPELLGVTRPPHPGKGAAKAIVQFTITNDTIVSDVEILGTEGYVDKGSLLECLGQWVFLPSRYASHDSPQKRVMAEVIYTASGNVLIQYPYPAPVAPKAPATATNTTK
jgi:TonB family protein